MRIRKMVVVMCLIFAISPNCWSLEDSVMVTTFDSYPPGAKLFYEDKELGVAPLTKTWLLDSKTGKWVMNFFPDNNPSSVKTIKATWTSGASTTLEVIMKGGQASAYVLQRPIDIIGVDEDIQWGNHVQQRAAEVLRLAEQAKQDEVRAREQAAQIAAEEQRKKEGEKYRRMVTTFDSYPPGAKIFYEGKELGVAPITKIWLMDGKSGKWVMNFFADSNPSIVKTIKAVWISGASTNLKVKMQGGEERAYTLQRPKGAEGVDGDIQWGIHVQQQAAEEKRQTLRNQRDADDAQSRREKNYASRQRVQDEKDRAFGRMLGDAISKGLSSGRGNSTTLCPDGNYVGGNSCVLTPNGTYVGVD